MSKPKQKKPNKKPGQDGQNPIQKPNGKQPTVAAEASSDILPAALAATALPASAKTIPASANILPAPPRLAPVQTSRRGEIRPAPATTLPAAANSFASGIQIIAVAYGDYTSLCRTPVFVEKLAGVRSFHKVIEVPTEYAKAAYETFVTESQKFCELYSELARQAFKPFEGFAAKANPAAP